MNYDIKKSGERIRQIRIKSGVTQEQVAGALNIDRSFYSRVKLAKKDALLSYSIQLSNPFLVSLDYLILGRYSGDLLESTDRAQMKDDIAKLVVRLEQFRITL